MISARIIADSICATRITTFLVVMPRYLLAESRSKRRCYEWRGKVWTLADLAKHVQMTPDVLAKRVKAGMTLEEAINKPWRLRAKREN